MAAASLIASAIGIVLLIIAAYVLVGGTVGTSEVVMRAESEMTDSYIRALQTEISIETSGESALLLTNSGSEMIDLSYTDLFVTEDTTMTCYPFTTWRGWTDNPAHAYLWRPGESITLNEINGKDRYNITALQVTTGNGRSSSWP